MGTACWRRQSWAPVVKGALVNWRFIKRRPSRHFPFSYCTMWVIYCSIIRDSPSACPCLIASITAPCRLIPRQPNCRIPAITLCPSIRDAEHPAPSHNAWVPSANREVLEWKSIYVNSLRVACCLCAGQLWPMSDSLEDPSMFLDYLFSG
jgi:hypothetical protein